MQECIKKVVVSSMLFAAVATFAATPTVTDVVAKQRFPWNGLVDITCTVSGIEGTTNGLYFSVAAVPETGDTIKVSRLWMIQNGAKSVSRDVCTNGNYSMLWDAQADLGTSIYSNMVVRVALKSHGKVQLWEGGPYWAETNIGAEEPWEYGYYFWWGDTVGYKRENNAWVASDNSTSNFSFNTDNTPTDRKYKDTLKNEGWITADEVLTPEHDAAQVQWSDGWRMPTRDELEVLNNNCDWIWTTTNGVNGYIVRGRGAYASASIFLPAAGNGIWTSLYNAGSFGIYWSSVPDPDSSGYACGLTFHSDDHDTNSSVRYAGGAVRPVQGFNE